MPAKKFAIRPATVEDSKAILDCIHGLAKFEKLEHEVIACEERIRETLFGERPAASALLAVDGLETLGFALYFTSYSTFLARPGIYLEDLFVFPENRGRGIGKALLGEVARIASERGCGRLEWSVLDWNRKAIEFYERRGARAQDEWTLYRVTGDALRALAVRE